MTSMIPPGHSKFLGVLPHTHNVPLSSANTALGYAKLDENTLIPLELLPQLTLDQIPVLTTDKLPPSIKSGLRLTGVWDAQTNEPGDPNTGKIRFTTNSMTPEEMGLTEPPTVGQFWVVTVPSDGNYDYQLTGETTDFSVNDFLVISGVNDNNDGTFILSFIKIDNTDTVVGVTLDGVVRTGTVVLDNAIGAAQIKDGSVTLEKMANDSVSTGNLVDASVSTHKLQADSVTEHKILNGNVTTEKLALGCVTSDQLADLAVEEDSLADGAVVSTKIQDKSVTRAKFPDTFGATGRVRFESIDTKSPAYELVFNQAANPGIAPGVTMRFDPHSGLTFMEVSRNGVSGDIRMRIHHRVCLPDNFADFKVASGELMFTVMATVSNDGGASKFGLVEILGQGSTDNMAIGNSAMIGVSHDTTDVFTTSVTGIARPQVDDDTPVVAGMTFLASVDLILSGAGGANQTAGYAGFEYAYLYQV